MSRLTYDKVRIISGSFGLQSLREFNICVKPNQHGRMWFTGIVHMDSAFSELEEQILNTVVSAVELNDNGGIGRTLFSGVVREVHICYDSGLYQIKACAVSGTYLLDMNTKNRFFQDVSMTYADVVKLVLQDTPDAAAIFTVGLDTPIGVPLIQYEETDWAFIRRIASHFNTPLIPETLIYKPHFWFGMRQGKEYRAFDEDEYKVVIDGAYYTMGGSGMGWRRRDFFYYAVESDQPFEIGDKSLYKQKNLKICEKAAEFRHGELYFSYKLGLESLVYEKTYYNDKICGLSLEGTVLETDREVVKIHLDIDGDKNWDAGTAYPYKWVPTSGNLMYLMPKLGTKVSLYICNHDERSAVATNCVRTNGAAHPEMGDFHKRYLTTEHDKRMYLFPDSMGLVGTSHADTALIIKMDDASGILAQSHDTFIISASEQVTVNASAFIMNCPAQITLKQGGTSLVINNQFDGVGAKSKLVGGGSSGGSPPEPEADEGGGFDCTEQGGTVLGSVPAVADPETAAAETARICGAGAAAASTVMAASTVGTAVMTKDMVTEAGNGDTGNPGKAMAAGAGGGAKGSVTGGAPSMNPAAASINYDTMSDRITEICGTTTHVRRDMPVPQAVQMCKPYLAESIFSRDSASFEVGRLMTRVKLPEPEPIELYQIRNPGVTDGPSPEAKQVAPSNSFLNPETGIAMKSC